MFILYLILRLNCGFLTERCLLYSLRLWGSSVESLRVAAGTIFNKVSMLSVWASRLTCSVLCLALIFCFFVGLCLFSSASYQIGRERREPCPSSCLTIFLLFLSSSVILEILLFYSFMELVLCFEINHFFQVLIWDVRCCNEEDKGQDCLDQSQKINHAENNSFPPKWTVEPLQALLGHEGSIYRITWSEDGLCLASASDDRRSVMLFQPLPCGRLLTCFKSFVFMIHTWIF